jgi:sensor c-di-GMP phosphodiesterase-like protein
MTMSSRILAYGLWIFASVCVFVAAGQVAATGLIGAQRFSQLDELGLTAMRRAESAVDFGVGALDELAAAGPLTCDAASLQAVRLHVYQRGTVKDIRATDAAGAVRCSAYSETLEFDKHWVSRSDMIASADRAVHLFRVDQFFGTALGVLKDIDADNAMVAVLGVSESLFDIMPEALRDHSEIVLELSDGRSIARWSTHPDAAQPTENVAVSVASKRYPLISTIRVETATLARWHNESYLPIMIGAVLLGLVFGPLLARATTHAEDPLAALDRGLAARQFRPYLQPIFDLRSGDILGCEVLARWVLPDGTVIPPARFVKLAEDNGRIQAMTWQLLSTALAHLKAHLKDDRAFKVSVNISPRHMIAPGFVGELRRLVATSGVSPRQITLEITEREGFDDLAQAATIVGELRSFGFRVALDDVGIGHSGLSQLQSLGADVLKIDKFFVDSITRDPTARSIVDMLVRLARELNMGIVAEGIEDDDQVAALIAHGVTQGQGYVVSPPLPAAEFLALLGRRATMPFVEPVAATSAA